MAVDGDQFLRKQHGVAVLLQRFAIAFALDLGGVFEHRLDAAKLDDQLHAALVANAGRARNVVHGVAAQGHHVHHFFRRHAQHFRHLGGVQNQVVLLRVQDLHLRGDQLHHVLVATDDEDRVLALGGLTGQGADDVVGLKADSLKDGDAQGLKGAANVGNLPPQVLGHGGAIGLVARVVHIVEALRLAVPLAQGANGARPLVAEDLAAHVEDGCKVLRRKVLAQLFDHVHEDVNSCSGQPVAGRHGTATLHRVVGAKDERHGVEEEYGRLGLVWHGYEFISSGTEIRGQGSEISALLHPKNMQSP